MNTDERRSYVREDLSFKIKFKIMSPEEYEDSRRFDDAIFSPFKMEYRDETAETAVGVHNTADASLINYLFQIDEKLDQILDLLSRDAESEPSLRPFDRGIGQNISGSGMKMLVNQPIEAGQIIHVKFFLSKFPLVFMDTFGEVIRVSLVEENGQTLYQHGIKFIELTEYDRERIISHVFQKQRESIRKKRNT